jgi:hypothetical protein
VHRAVLAQHAQHRDVNQAALPSCALNNTVIAQIQ